MDFVYPSICTCCNDKTDANNIICERCWNAIPIVTENLPLYEDTRSKLLANGYIEELVTCFVFRKDSPLQHIVHRLKYSEYESIGIELGKRIGLTIQNRNLEFDFIVPVPLHRIKMRERGYNQSEAIAKGISSIINKPIETKIIKRTKYTLTQTKLNSEQRRENMKDAFQVIPKNLERVNGKKCLLVDDIITTGTTANSCAKELYKNDLAIIATSVAIAERDQ